ncbi:MAG: helicase C-terminal domain-containing protein [Pseudomonas sp.]
MRNLRATVMDLLGEGGAFSREIPGWITSAEQLDYAGRVCAMLEARNRRGDARPALATLEASTGIGKTYGYLVPLLVYAHLTGRRVAVATCTLDLLHSINRNAQPTADRIVSAALGKVPLRSALRVGMPEFVSLQRVHELLGELPEAHRATATLKALAKFAQDSHSGATTGLLRDWLQSGYTMPAGVAAEQVCLQPWCPAPDMEAYARQGERAVEASVLLTTQAAMLMHCLRRIDVVSGAEDLPDIDAVVIDEADAVPDMAELVTGIYLPINALAGLVSQLDNGNRPAVRKARAQLAEATNGLAPLLDTVGSQKALLHGNFGAKARPAVLQATSAIKDVLALVRKQSSVRADPELLSRVSGWADQLRFFTAALDAHAGYRAAFVQQSPVRGYLGLGVISTSPGRVLSQLWRQEVGEGGVRAILMTSATLVAPGDSGMAAFHREVGIDPAEHRLIEAACGLIEPAHHGHMSLVLADPRAPRPFSGVEINEVEEAQIQSGWLSYVSDIVQAAGKQGGRILVLTGAYRDTHFICEVLRERGLEPVEAKRGTRDEEVARFLASPTSVWVTPSAWEGVDLPGAIAHLVIARIPYQSTTAGPAAAFQEMLLARGLDANAAFKITAARNRSKVARKLRQGLGRPLRRRDDRATVWFADSRFPLPLALRDAWLRKHRRVQAGTGDVALSGVIPTRFRDGPHQVFGIDKSIWSPE